MTNGKQDQTIAKLETDLAALAATVAALQSDACHCGDIARARARKSEHEKRSRFDTIANLPRGERNLQIENFSAVDLEAYWRSISGDAILRCIVEAPSHAKQDQWLSLVHDPIAKRRARVHMHVLPERVRVVARGGMTSDVTERTIVISREQYDRLAALGHDVSRVITETGYAGVDGNPYAQREVRRLKLITSPITAKYRYHGTRELLDALAEVDRALALAIEHGDLIVMLIPAEENRVLQIREDVTRTPDTLRKLERLPLGDASEVGS